MKLAIQWSEQLSTGIKKFDDQHKKLIGMVNELYHAMSEGKGKEILGKIINGLIQYTVEHFADEEKAMLANNYNGYLEHKKQHDDLKSEVTEFMKKYNTGERTTVDLLGFLTNWVTNHILVTDKKYGPFIKKI